MGNSLKIFIVCVDYDDYLARTLIRNIETLPDCAEIFVVTSEKDYLTQNVVTACGANLIISKRINSGGARISKGKAINDAIESVCPDDWILLLDADILLQPNMITYLMNYGLDEDCLYYVRRWGPKEINKISELLYYFDAGVGIKVLFEKFANKEISKKTFHEDNAIECQPFGYFQLFNKKSKSLIGRDKIYVEGHDNAGMDDHLFGSFVFPSEKRIALPEVWFDVIHLPHGKYGQNWNGRVSESI